MSNTVDNNSDHDRELKEAYWKGHSEALMIVLEQILVREYGWDRVRQKVHALHKETSSKWKNFQR